MEEQLISFDTAVLAKEKGFNEKSLYFYSGEQEEARQINLKGHSNSEFVKFYSAPTQGLLQKWLREKHGIDITIHRSFSMKKSYHYCIIKNCDYEMESLQVCVPDRNYEDVLESAIVDALNLI